MFWELALKTHETLAALKSRLNSLNRNGSNRSAPLYFEDSEICRSSPFFSCRSSRCVLMDFVPEKHRSEPVPCRFIPLNHDGQTLHHLYRTGTAEETQANVRGWLLSVIVELESAASKARDAA
jgi:hypothetical protein